MLKSFLISSGVLPLIMFATVLHPTSLEDLVQTTQKIERGKCSQEWLDIQVIRREDDLEEHFLVNSNEFLIPLADVSCSLARVVRVLLSVWRRQRLSAVVLAVLKDLNR